MNSTLSVHAAESFRHELNKIANVLMAGGKRYADKAFAGWAARAGKAGGRQPLVGTPRTGIDPREIIKQLKAKSQAAGPGPLANHVNSFPDTAQGNAMLAGVTRNIDPVAAKQFFGRPPVNRTAATQVMKRTAPAHSAVTQAMTPQVARQPLAAMTPQVAKQPVAARATAALQQQGASPGILTRMRQMATGQ